MTEKVLTISTATAYIKYIDTITVSDNQYAIFVDYSTTNKIIYAIYYDDKVREWTYVKGL